MFVMVPRSSLKIKRYLSQIDRKEEILRFIVQLVLYLYSTSLAADFFWKVDDFGKKEPKYNKSLKGNLMFKDVCNDLRRREGYRLPLQGFHYPCLFATLPALI